jgi:Pyruvate/2-oxoacid:ferredoxin oxidoreductase delta subunit
MDKGQLESAFVLHAGSILRGFRFACSQYPQGLPTMKLTKTTYIDQMLQILNGIIRNYLTLDKIRALPTTATTISESCSVFCSPNAVILGSYPTKSVDYIHCVFVVLCSTCLSDCRSSAKGVLSHMLESR